MQLKISVITVLFIIFLSLEIVYVNAEYFSVQDYIYGEKSILFVPVDFQDFVHTVDIRNLSDLINDVKLYFRNVSYNQVTLSVELIDWVRLWKNMSYYGDYNNVNDHSRGAEYLIKDTIKIIDKSMNFSKYDYVVIIYAGYNEAITKQTDDIWSWGWSRRRRMLQVDDP